MKRALVANGLLLAALAPLSSCLALAAGAAAGAAGAVYVQGDLETDVDATPPQVVKASEAALEDLSMPLRSSDSTELDGRVESSTAEKPVKIVAKSRGQGVTHVSIRVGTFGDQRESVRILEAIRSHL